MTVDQASARRKPRITLIVARSRNGVIGRDNAMPWKIPGEQAYFKRVTMGHPIVMGRKTWESIGRPLPGRRNIVVTRDPDLSVSGAEIAHGVEDAFSVGADASEIFVIGGAQLYDAAMPFADRLLITEIDADFEGDTCFPAVDPAGWIETARETHPPTAERPFRFAYVEYQRRRAVSG